MPHERSRPVHFQTSLLEEPEATLAVRVHQVRGDAFCAVSYTITRPDDSWLACEVITCRNGPETVRTTLAEVTRRGIRDLERLIGPF